MNTGEHTVENDEPTALIVIDPDGFEYAPLEEQPNLTAPPAGGDA